MAFLRSGTAIGSPRATFHLGPEPERLHKLEAGDTTAVRSTTVTRIRRYRLWEESRYNLLVWDAAEAAAREKGWKLLSFPIGDVDEIDGALRAATTARAGTLLQAAGLPLDPHPQRVVDLAAKHRLPAMYHFRYYVERGGLACYAPDLIEIWRASAVFVDKILKGAKPGDLPVEQPTKLDLVVNLKTAKTLSLTIPQSFLLRADVIEQ